MMHRLATTHKFHIGMVSYVLNINEAWPASAWWWRQSRSAPKRALCHVTPI